jgi:hypothetical protein
VKACGRWNSEWGKRSYPLPSPDVFALTLDRDIDVSTNNRICSKCWDRHSDHSVSLNGRTRVVPPSAPSPCPLDALLSAISPLSSLPSSFSLLLPLLSTHTRPRHRLLDQPSVSAHHDPWRGGGGGGGGTQWVRSSRRAPREKERDISGVVVEKGVMAWGAGEVTVGSAGTFQYQARWWLRRKGGHGRAKGDGWMRAADDRTVPRCGVTVDSWVVAGVALCCGDVAVRELLVALSRSALPFRPTSFSINLHRPSIPTTTDHPAMTSIY